MYIRNREEALDALSGVLALDERREQIIQITVKVALCLDADARRFLAGCQAGLLEGGLEYMRKKRREMIENATAASNEPIILIDSSADQLLEVVGSCMDALRVTEIILQVFPVIAKKFDRWQVARAVVGEEAAIQYAVKAAVRERNGGNPDRAAEMQAKVIEKIIAGQPAWIDQRAALRAAVERAVKDVPSSSGPGGANDTDLVFNILAAHEDSAKTVFDFLQSAPADAIAYINEVRQRVDQLLALEERSDAA